MPQIAAASPHVQQAGIGGTLVGIIVGLILIGVIIGVFLSRR